MNDFPNSYVAYLVQFHATRDYFECHELLEEYWKEHPDDPLADTWVGLIQLAVGQYHERRGNYRGASMMYAQAERRLQASPLEQVGLDKESLLTQLSGRITALQSCGQVDYEDINIPIVSEHLKLACSSLCTERGLVWGIRSPMENEAIIQRHKLRDRSEVIAARVEALVAKKRERNGKS